MFVFLKRLPAGTRKTDIEDFIAKAVQGGLFSRRGSIKNISIIERRNPQLNVLDYHGVITIEPDSAAKRVIQKMNGKLFKGKYIEVRRFYIRKSNNNGQNKSDSFEEVPGSPKVERRQEDANASLSFQGVKDFHRKG